MEKVLRPERLDVSPNTVERIFNFFNFQCRSTSGSSIPSWPAIPGPILIKRHVWSSKFNPPTDEVHLIKANPQYAYVRYPDGKKDTVALKHWLLSQHQTIKF